MPQKCWVLPTGQVKDVSSESSAARDGTRHLVVHLLSCVPGRQNSLRYLQKQGWMVNGSCWAQQSGCGTV
eukprot:3028713-Amphidinium_carterae.1